MVIENKYVNRELKRGWTVCDGGKKGGGGNSMQQASVALLTFNDCFWLGMWVPLVV